MRINIKKAIKPIKTEKEYKHALKMIEKLMDAKKGSSDADLLNVITLLVEKYEEKHYSIPQPDPIEAIKFRMEQLGLTQKDMVEIIGSKSRVSEIFNRKRKLTVRMIKTLHTALGVPAESLLGA
jgi:HTH-type transcriptional regulator/antitoxin HigA